MNSQKADTALLEALLARGVDIRHPGSVVVEASVRPENIAPGVVIHAGCRLRGDRLTIGPDCEIGLEAPVTLENCQLARGVRLAGGFFSGSVFLDGARVGSGAHVRPGSILEEEASAAHCVGLKQTILFPYVTLGSLINLCDCLVSGGTGPRNHSEVGSSYIHFNFTPHGDKATASLLGDVPQGVMLDKAPIFLGGQGGLVGPARIAFGSVLAAGVICRQDILVENHLYAAHSDGPKTPVPYDPGFYTGLRRLVINNLHYIGNIKALRVWYEEARRPFLSRTVYGQACLAGALRALDLILEERVRRMDEVAEKIASFLADIDTGRRPDPGPAALAGHRRFVEGWATVRQRLGPLGSRRFGTSASQEPGASVSEQPGASVSEQLGASRSQREGIREREIFLAEWEKLLKADSYLEAVRSLTPQAKAAGTAWLQAVVDEVGEVAAELLCGR